MPPPLSAEELPERVELLTVSEASLWMPPPVVVVTLPETRTWFSVRLPQL